MQLVSLMVDTAYIGGMAEIKHVNGRFLEHLLM